MIYLMDCQPEDHVLTHSGEHIKRKCLVNKLRIHITPPSITILIIQIVIIVLSIIISFLISIIIKSIDREIVNINLTGSSLAKI